MPWLDNREWEELVLHRFVKSLVSFAPVVVLALALLGVVGYTDHAHGVANAAGTHELPLRALPGPELHDVHLSVATNDDAVYQAAGTYEGVPVCTDHNPNTWHPLVKRDASGKVTCTYTHEHHDDPRSINDIFGPPGAWYGRSDSISYPWMTSNTTTGALENAAKHDGYKWFVRRNLPCIPFGGATGCIVAYRAEVHVRGDVSDQTTRFHSFMLEVLVRDAQGRQGIVRNGGHLDTGFLGLLVDGGNVTVCPPIPENPENFNDLLPDSCRGSGKHRESSSLQAPAGHTDHNVYHPAWYTGHGITPLGVQLEEWGPIAYANPMAQHFHPAVRRANNSRGNIGIMAVQLNNSAWIGKVGPNGLINFKGYTDRNGAIVSGCSTPSVNCVPVSIEGVSAANYQYNGASHPLLREMREYDVSSPVTGGSLIRYPN